MKLNHTVAVLTVLIAMSPGAGFAAGVTVTTGATPNAQVTAGGNGATVGGNATTTTNAGTNGGNAASSAASSQAAGASSSQPNGASSSMAASSSAEGTRDNCGSIASGAVTTGTIDSKKLASVTKVSIEEVTNCSGVTAALDPGAAATLSGSASVQAALKQAGISNGDIIGYVMDGSSLEVFVKRGK